MAKFSISVWVEIEAEDSEDARRAANMIVGVLRDLGDDVGIIDVEELDE